MARTYLMQTGLALLGAACLAAVGCGSLDRGDETCETEDNCIDTVRTENPLLDDPEWGCLRVNPPALAPPTGDGALYGLPVVDWASTMPLSAAGLQAQLCPVLPGECPQPFTPQPYAVTPGAVAGMPLPSTIPPVIAPIPVFDGFDGFIRFQVIDSSPTTRTYLPLAFYVGARVVGQMTINTLPVLMIRKDTLAGVIEESFARSRTEEVEVDVENLGVVALRAINCQGQPADGVRFTINDQGVIPFQLPTSRLPIAPEPPYETPIFTDETDLSGAAGFVNVTPGTKQVQAYRRGETEPFSTAQLGVVGGQITVAVIKPAYFNTAAVAPPPPPPPATAGAAN